MIVEAGYCTHTGQRRDNNEDSYLVDDHLAVFAVADGMGGHRGGEVASATAIEALRAAVANGLALPDAVAVANRSVWDRSHDDYELNGMGTTMTAVSPLADDQLLIAHVGDSRAYLVREHEIALLTEDHSLVGELFREGAITREQADVHPQRAVITRAVGLEPTVDVSTYTVGVQRGDRIVICSDGLHDMLRDREIEQLASDETPEVAANRLVDAANLAGGDDNITVVVLAIDGLAPVTGLTTRAPADAATMLGERNSVPIPRAAPEPVAPPPPSLPRRSIGRRIVATFPVLLPLIVIVGIAAGTLGWYARNSYFATITNGEVVVKQGQPGGLLGWEPTVKRHTGISIADLTQADQELFSDGVGIEGSASRVDAFIDRLTDSTTTTTTASSSTTTRPTSTTRTTRPSRTTTTNRRAVRTTTTTSSSP